MAGAEEAFRNVETTDMEEACNAAVGIVELSLMLV